MLFRSGFSLVVASRAYSLAVVHRLLLAVPSLDVEAQALGSRSSVVAAPRLWSSGSGVVAHGLRDMWGLPRAGIEPASPALAGRFLTPGPPGTPRPFFHVMVFFLLVHRSSSAFVCPEPPRQLFVLQATSPSL